MREENKNEEVKISTDEFDNQMKQIIVDCIDIGRGQRAVSSKTI